MNKSYNQDMYLNYTDLQNIEDQIYRMTTNIQQTIYGKTSALRNIQVGDNLSNKTLYLSFPRNIDESLSDTNYQNVNVIKVNDNIHIYYYKNENNSNNTYSSSCAISIKCNQKFNEVYYREVNPYSVEPLNDVVTDNVVRIKLPREFGIVTEINNSNSVYNNIKIYDDESVLPNYVKKTWNVNEIPSVQDIDRIENGIENMGNYFSKPKGWMTSKEWLQTKRLFESQEDYYDNYDKYTKDTISYPFSYHDINRWINNLNLIENIDAMDVTLWNTNISQYYWNLD